MEETVEGEADFTAELERTLPATLGASKTAEGASETAEWASETAEVTSALEKGSNVYDQTQGTWLFYKWTKAGLAAKQWKGNK